MKEETDKLILRKTIKLTAANKQARAGHMNSESMALRLLMKSAGTLRAIKKNKQKKYTPPNPLHIRFNAERKIQHQSLGLE